MTLNVREPTDQRMVNELPLYIREDRAAINAVTTGAGFSVNNLTITVGTTSLTVGTELAVVGHEIVNLTGDGLSTLATILGGTDGQIKTFIFQDTNVDMTDGVKSAGKFYLDHLPALSDFTPAQDDILCIINVGGDGASSYGYWKELYRTISVK